MAQQKSNRCFSNHNILNRLFDYNVRYASNRNEEYDFVDVISNVRNDEIRVIGLLPENKRQIADRVRSRGLPDYQTVYSFGILTFLFP